MATIFCRPVCVQWQPIPFATCISGWDVYWDGCALRAITYWIQCRRDMISVMSVKIRTQARWGQRDDVIKWKHFPRYWPLCGEFTGHRWILLTQRPVARSFGVFFDSLICAGKKRLSKETWGWWFDTPSSSLWRHCNDLLFSVSDVFITGIPRGHADL